MDKNVSMETALSELTDGMTLMIGGFLGVGTPKEIIDSIVNKGLKDLTIICNDTAFPDVGIGKLIVNKQVKKVITSHIGTNKETVNQMNTGEIEVILTPQGTLAEQIRCGGAGLGGFLTPTGVGTIVEDGKEIIKLNGVKYILEKELHADYALLSGSKVDSKGNIFYNKATRNFNPLMALAADTVIVEAENLVEIGSIDPHLVMTPGEIVTYIVRGEII